MFEKNKFSGFAFSFLALLLYLCAAQSHADNGDMDVLGDELSLFQDIPSVFSASKYEQKITEAPSSVTVITADEIKKSGYRTLAEILASVRGFYTFTDHNYEYVGVRGFARPGDYNSRILLLIDGHRMNDEVYSGAAIGLDMPIDVDLIERVEIVRGPSSSLYGTSAFFGVINIQTKNGRDLKGLEASALAGSHDLIGGRLSYGEKFSQGLELLISGSWSQTNGDDWYFEEFDDPYYNDGRAEGIDELEAYHFFLKGQYADFTLTATYNNRQDGYPTAAWETDFNNPDSDVEDEYFSVDLLYSKVTSAGLELTGRAFYDYYYYHGVYPYDWADYEADPEADPYILNGHDYVDSRRLGVSFQVSQLRWGKHHLILGTEYRNGYKLEQEYYNFREETLGPLYDYIIRKPLDSNEDSQIWGLFLQDEYRINDQLLLNIGLRYDNYSTFGGTLNPRIALIYQPRDTSTLKFLYGTAYRAPSAYELYYGDGGESQLPNPELDPETIDTYEIVWEEQLNRQLRLVVNPFYYEISDLITQQTIIEDDWPLLIFKNVDEIEAYGIEFELEGTVLEKIVTRLNYSYQKVENQTTGEDLSNSPEHLAKLNLTFPIWKDRLYLNVEEIYTSSVLAIDLNERLDSSWVTNLALFAEDTIEGLELSLRVNNLLDEDYAVPGSGEHAQIGLQQPGRNFVFKATYAF